MPQLNQSSFLHTSLHISGSCSISRPSQHRWPHYPSIKHKYDWTVRYRLAAELLWTGVSDSAEVAVSCAGSSARFPQCPPAPALSTQSHSRQYYENTSLQRSTKVSLQHKTTCQFASHSDDHIVDYVLFLLINVTTSWHDRNVRFFFYPMPTSTNKSDCNGTVCNNNISKEKTFLLRRPIQRQFNKKFSPHLSPLMSVMHLTTLLWLLSFLLLLLLLLLLAKISGKTQVTHRLCHISIDKHLNEHLREQLWDKRLQLWYIYLWHKNTTRHDKYANVNVSRYLTCLDKSFLKNSKKWNLTKKRHQKYTTQNTLLLIMLQKQNG